MFSSLAAWPAAIQIFLTLSILSLVEAQQYAGDVIPNSLPSVPGSMLAYFRMPSPSGTNQSLTLTQYVSTSSSGGILTGPSVKRAVIVIHGLQRDPQNYMSAMLSARGVVTDPSINADSVAINAPYFPSGDDKNVGYPWVNGLAAGKGSNTSALVWKGSNWADGANNQYPWYSTTMSSFAAIDQLVQYYNDPSIFPNMQQVVLAGHSLGAQLLHRYVAVGDILSLRVPLSYYIANPNSYLWFTPTRPLDTSTCPTYDDWRAGLNAYTASNSYGTGIVAQGRSAVLARYNSRQIAYAHGTQDFGDDSSDCAPFTTGANRAERFFNFLKAFPPSCTTGGTCDTVDYVDAGHDATLMFTSTSGSRRLFQDNFDGSPIAFDIGCPRLQAGDDPYPDPAGCTNTTTNSTTSGPTVYAGNMTYFGCWSDQAPASLPFMAYQSGDNTIEKCTSTCAAAGYTIAGAEFGSQCFCGNQLTSKAVQTVDLGCTMACAGNSSEICGDGNRLSIYSNGPPTVLSAPIFPATVGPYSFLGCYTDNTAARSLTGAAQQGSTNSLESCAAFCSGFSYFGTEFGAECYCGNSLSSASTSSSLSSCSMLCAANETEFCGAGNFLTVYFTNQTLSSSSSSVAPSSTTSAASSSSSSPVATGGPLSCPGSNGVVYTTSTNDTFLVECSVDHAGFDMGSTGATTLEACINACDATTGCLAFSWVSGGSNACYLKSGVGAPNSNTLVWGGKLLTNAGSGSSSSSSQSTSTTATAATSSKPTAASSTSAFSSLAAAATGTVACPADNGKTWTGSDGAVFLVECSIDHAGGDFTFVYTANYGLCFNACDTTPTCVAFSYVPASMACYMKNAVGFNQINSGVWGAHMLSAATGAPATTTAAATSSKTSSATATSSSAAAGVGDVCPGANGKNYTGTSGQVFLMECYNDHAGGDLMLQYTNTYDLCIAACDATPSCVAFSWVAGGSSACYLKNAIGNNQNNNAVWGGKLIKSIASSTTSSTASPTPTVATFTCPDSNGTVYHATNGQNYLVQCVPL